MKYSIITVLHSLFFWSLWDLHGVAGASVVSVDRGNLESHAFMAEGDDTDVVKDAVMRAHSMTVHVQCAGSGVTRIFWIAPFVHVRAADAL